MKKREPASKRKPAPQTEKKAKKRTAPELSDEKLDEVSGGIKQPGNVLQCGVWTGEDAG